MNSAKELLRHRIDQLSEAEARQTLEFVQSLQQSSNLYHVRLNAHNKNFIPRRLGFPTLPNPVPRLVGFRWRETQPTQGSFLLRLIIRT